MLANEADTVLHTGDTALCDTLSFLLQSKDGETAAGLLGALNCNTTPDNPFPQRRPTEIVPLQSRDGVFFLMMR